MGLDMYLNATRYLYDNDALAIAVRKLIGTPEGMDVKSVQLEAAYWRKSNQIHSWFVTNVQDGKDECQSSDVSREKLEELLSLVKRVLADRTLAETLLTPVGGFFFGSTDIDDWYWRDLENTVEMLTRALALPKGWYFEYRASW